MLALGKTGKVDEETFPIVGVEEIDDAESLTAGPNDTFYLLTSHAPNRQGKLNKTRRQLLLLKLEQRRLRVMGNVDLLHGKGDIRTSSRRSAWATPPSISKPSPTETARSTSA